MNRNAHNILKYLSKGTFLKSNFQSKINRGLTPPNNKGMIMRIKMAFLFFFVCSYLHAEDAGNVGDWTQQILIDTLSASYKDTPAEIEAVKKNYLPYAWGPMNQFLLDKRIEINEKQLTLHPKPLTNPKVTESTNCGVSPCWNVEQIFYIPELLLNVYFSLQVTTGAIQKDSTSPFMIRSLSIVIKDS